VWRTARDTVTNHADNSTHRASRIAASITAASVAASIRGTIHGSVPSPSHTGPVSAPVITQAPCSSANHAASSGPSG
jgi:hypothetical protein